MLKVIALRDHHVIVPILLLDLRLDVLRLAERADDFDLRLLAVARFHHDLLATLGQNAAAALLIKDSAVGLRRLEVRLITTDDWAEVAVLNHLAAVLNAGVGEAHGVVRYDSVLQPQLEVAHLALPHEEGVVFDLRLRVLARLAGNRAVLHGPKLGIALPAIEILAVE